MKKSIDYKAIGIMSGTSLDGIDIAYCQFSLQDGIWSYKILNAESNSYSEQWVKNLRNSVNYSVEELLQLDYELGLLIGERVKVFIQKHLCKPEFIASHGHTVFHQPHRGFTHQIGNPYQISITSGYPVIADFRSLDVALGGEGAPLVPIGDRLLFPEYAACLNLGGISNISFEKEGSRIAYDISAANMILNYITEKIGKAYDEGGAIARSGTVDLSALRSLLAEQEKQAKNRKSLGFEWVSSALFPILEEINSIEHALATGVEFVASTIANDIRDQQLQGKLMAAGGGAFNDYLVERLKENLPNEVELIIPDKEIIMFKEAMVFAFLGVLKATGQVNVLSSVTGASRDSSGGIYYDANNRTD